MSNGAVRRAENGTYEPTPLQSPWGTGVKTAAALRPLPGNARITAPYRGTPYLAQPSTSCTQNLLWDASFEYSSVTAWPQQDLAGAVSEQYVTGSSQAHEGSGFLQTSTVASGGSVQQTLSYGTSANNAYEGVIWVKADAQLNAPITGHIKITSSGINTTESDSTSFSVGNTWTPVTVQLDQTASHNTLAFTLTMSTTNVLFDWDAASLYNAGIPDGGIEIVGDSHWMGLGNLSAASYTDSMSSLDGQRYGVMQTTGGGSLYQPARWTARLHAAWRLNAVDPGPNPDGYVTGLGSPREPTPHALPGHNVHPSAGGHSPGREPASDLYRGVRVCRLAGLVDMIRLPDGHARPSASVERMAP